MKKLPYKPAAPAITLFIAVLMLLLADRARAAGPFTVNNTNDTHVSNTTTGTDTAGHITLRSAIEAANAGGGATINVPAGTYNLSLGELAVAPNGAQTDIIQASGGANSSNVIINQTDGINRVFNIDSTSHGNTQVTLSGLTIQGGHDKADNLGGAGILAGSVDNSPKDVLTLTSCVIQNNHCVEVSAGYTAGPGGGVQMAGGDLLITSCTFSNNTSGAAFGGGIFFLNQVVAASLNITNSLLVNNSMTNDSGSGPDGGGGIMIDSTAASTHSFTSNIFGGNQVIGTFGNTFGGAIQMNGGALTVSASTFTNNSATNQGAQGGAIYLDSGTLNVSFSRFVGNSSTNAGNVVFNHTANGATSTVDNNWWGTNTGPTAADLNGVSANTYLKLNLNANPALIATNFTTTLAANVLTNSAGTSVSAANLGALIGLPITFGNAVKGTISSAQPVITPAGTATASFTSGAINGPASATATLDNAVVTAAISIQCPTIIATASGGGPICAGSSGAVTVTVTGGAGPYTVILNNGGGTKTSASPVVLNVSPATATVYSVISVVDANGCTATTSGSASFTVNALPLATITPTPSAVCANSIGNQAAGPAGLTGYSWTITNGTIISSTHAQTISYNVGSAGTVSLALTVTNSSGCTSNSFTVITINPIPTATITGTPAVVSANSPGNAASGPAGAAGYAWTITNGFFTSATNVQTISYVAGPEGGVQLGLTVNNASGCSSNTALTVPIQLSSPPPAGWSFRTNYFASMTFTDALTSTTMPLTFDGTNYWSCSGGGAAGVRLAQYDTNGVKLATFSPGLDFRSIFTDGNGAILARAFGDTTIYLQTSPGVFVPSGVSLNGGTVDAQSSVVMNGAGTEYIATSGGVVSRWDADGNFIGTVALKGFGTVSGESGGTPARGLAAFGNFWLTYNGNDIVSVWDTFGNRLALCLLSGAGTNADSEYGFCYANGKVFIVDINGGIWRGYDVGSSGQVAIYGAPNTAAWNNDVQGKIMGTGSFVKVDANLVTGVLPIPTLANLVKYEAVLFYSDSGFTNGVALGDALASYVDAGGGVAVGVFGFSTGLGIQGRLFTGNYLPFSEDGQGGSANLTLVEDVPTHQIFTGVSSFNGGSASYQNVVVITNGGAQIGHWSNGQPLVGIKDIQPGRVVGLNFFPPSSDARADFWMASTGGGTLMANSLLWAGHVPPVFMTGPGNLIKSSGNTASFTTAVAGLPPLTYQWRKDGTNIPGATGSGLSFISQNGSNGQYSVTVSNSYGIAVSEIATLSPPLRFLSFNISNNGAISLLLGTADGSPLTAFRASRINIFSSTNLTTPFSNWTKLPNPLLLGNGVLRVQGLNVTSSQNFFQAAEAP